MWKTDINPEKCALLIIDVQSGLFKKSTPIYHGDQLLHNIQEIVDRAHRCNVPVFYIQHSDQKALVTGSEDWQLHPALQPGDADQVIHKRHGNAFQDTSLDLELKSRRLTELVVMGLVTHGCVRATCLGARELGYRVVLVEDGHSSYSKQAAELIEEWNHKLGAGTVELLPTSAINFTLARQPR